MTEDGIGNTVVNLAVQIHRALGSGLLESVYETVLTHELRAQGLLAERQVPIVIRYRDIQFEEGFRADILIEKKVIVELKSVERLHHGHKKQLLSYLRLSGMHLGFLLNFGSRMMRDGIVRTVNGLIE